MYFILSLLLLYFKFFSSYNLLVKSFQLHVLDSILHIDHISDNTAFAHGLFINSILEVSIINPCPVTHLLARAVEKLMTSHIQRILVKVWLNWPTGLTKCESSCKWEESDNLLIHHIYCLPRHTVRLLVGMTESTGFGGCHGSSLREVLLLLFCGKVVSALIYYYSAIKV